MQYIAMDEYSDCHGYTLADTLDECVEKAIAYYGRETIKRFGGNARPLTKESLIAAGISFIEFNPVLGCRVKE